MSKFKRMHLVVDSVGIGAAPDANNFVNEEFQMEHLILWDTSLKPSV